MSTSTSYFLRISECGGRCALLVCRNRVDWAQFYYTHSMRKASRCNRIAALLHSDRKEAILRLRRVAATNS